MSAPAATQIVDLRHRGLDVLRVRGRHALHGDRMSAPHRDRADANGYELDYGAGPRKTVLKRDKGETSDGLLLADVPQVATGSNHFKLTESHGSS